MVAELIRQGPSWIIALGTAAGALGLGAILTNPGGTDPTHTPTPTQAAVSYSLDPEPSPAETPGDRGGSAPELRPDELLLQQGVPDEYRDTCEPKRAELPPRTYAAIECKPADGPADMVGYYLIPDARAYYVERVAAEGLEMNTGGCPPSAGEPAGLGEGIVMPTGIEGSETRLACFVRDGYAHLRLLIPGRDVYVGVAGRSPSDDLSALVD